MKVLTLTLLCLFLLSSVSTRVALNKKRRTKNPLDRDLRTGLANLLNRELKQSFSRRTLVTRILEHALETTFMDMLMVRYLLGSKTKKMGGRNFAQNVQVQIQN